MVARSATDVCWWWKRDGLTVDQRLGTLVKKMALDAVKFMRTGTRGSPSWPGPRPQAGYVDADCSDRSAEITCGRGGPYVFLPCAILESRSYNQAVRAGDFRPFDHDGTVVICS